ncbi:MAG: GAF domain-containing protein [Spirochaetes bacterium]|nr:GAF domain-containing protein [Spirochaetota bacterium]
MDFILNPLITLNIKENFQILKSFIKENFNIDSDFFLYINGKIYYLNSSIIQNIKTEIKTIDEFNPTIITLFIKEYLKNNNIKLHYIAFVENSKIILTFNNQLNEKSLNFIQNYIINVLMKNLYEYKVLNYEDEIKTLTKKYSELKNLRDIIFNITLEIEKEFDFSKIIHNILQLLLQQTKSDCCSISIPQKDNFTFCYISDKEHEKLRNMLININEGLIGKAYSEKKIIIENNPNNSTIWNKNIAKELNYFPDAIVANPIIDKKGNVVGILEIFKKGKDEIFTEDDIKIIKIFSFFILKLIKNE